MYTKTKRPNVRAFKEIASLILQSNSKDKVADIASVAEGFESANILTRKQVKAIARARDIQDLVTYIRNI